MRKRAFQYLMSLSAIALAQGAAFTQAAVAAGETDELNFEEIIVTANKREQRLIDVPMAIATMQGAELEERGIDSIQDLSFAVPGLTMREDGPGSYQVFLRGLANAYGGGALSSVYQDEIPMVLNGYNILPTRTLDLARIEVLKGPQGTLYGQGAVGGAIRYITNSPNLEEFEASLSGELYTVDSGSMGTAFTAIVNAPIIEDKLALRVAAEFRNGGGWQDQPGAGIEDGNDEKLTNINAKLLWKPTDELEVLANVISYNAEYELGLGYENPDRTVYVADDSTLAQIPKIWDYEIYSLKVTYDFGFAELLSSTAYADMEHQYPFSYFGGPDTIYEGGLAGTSSRYNPGDQFTQELRLTSSGEGPFQWTVGGFYRDFEVFLDIPDGLTYFGPDVFPFTYTSANTSESISLFADASYQITDKLMIGAGIRYFEDDQTEALAGVADVPATFDSFDPRVYLSYSVNDDVNIYASVAKGFRSGGFNGFGLPTFEPEKVYSYELGTKGSFLDGALYLDLAAFYTQYNNMQVRSLILVDGGVGLTSLISNIGQGEVKGIELSFSWKATDALTISGSGTVIDAEITEAGEGGTFAVGDPIDYVGDASFTLSANYDFTWSDDLPGFARVDYSYRSELPYTDRGAFPAENVPQFSDTISLVNARIGLQHDNVSVELYAQNLFNVNKWIDPYHAWNNANRTKPRTVGIKVGLDF